MALATWAVAAAASHGVDSGWPRGWRRRLLATWAVVAAVGRRGDNGGGRQASSFGSAHMALAVGQQLLVTGATTIAMAVCMRRAGVVTAGLMHAMRRGDGR